MNSNKETIMTYIQNLQDRIARQEKEINKLNKFNFDKKQYKLIILVLSILLIISSGISISLLI